MSDKENVLFLTWKSKIYPSVEIKSTKTKVEFKFTNMSMANEVSSSWPLT